MGSSASKTIDDVPKPKLEDGEKTLVQVRATPPVVDTEIIENKVESGGCPMKRGDGSYSYDWGALFRLDFPHKPSGSKPLNAEQIKSMTKDPSNLKDSVPTSAEGGGCPMKKSSQSIEYDVYSRPILNPSNNMPLNPNQLPAANQAVSLSTDRVASSIPKGGGADGKSTWTYPSPQMFYNALSRKGKLQDTPETDMESVVALHNNMNEKTWKMVMEWERTILGSKEESDCGSRLLRFQGRPTDLSPKAAFKHYILGHPLPYDRHDWVVERADGTVQRYVIDYYFDETRARNTPDTALPSKDDKDGTPSLLVDVRPALDTPDSLWHRTITMPYALHVSKTTNFTPLPLQATSALKSTVQESIAVWQTIQQNAAGTSTMDQKNIDELRRNMTLEKATELSKLFALIKDDCKATNIALDNCKDENDCARCSIDLTVCMGKIACPLQHEALIRVLTDEKNEDDSAIEIALARVNECLSQKTLEHSAAKLEHPGAFR